MQTTVLVDSSVWIDFFNGAPTDEAERLALILPAVPVAIADLVAVEVLQGFRSDQQVITTKAIFDVLTWVTIVDRQVSLQAVVNYRYLRKKAITVRKTIDCLIATYCIINRVPLLFSDRDFDPFVEHLGLIKA
jgi:predicted nucleic acid-binding protein